MPPRLLPLLRFVLVCILSLAVTRSVAQTTRLVGPGQTYTTIQSGINAANNGDTVLVSPGTYYENIDFMGKAITVTSSGGAAVTTIDGGKATNTVVFQAGEPRGAVLSNFTVTHGIPPVNSNFFSIGGGVFIQNSQPTILNNVITQNYCQNVYSLNSAPLLQGNTISFSLTPGSCENSYTGGLMINGDLFPANGQPGASAMVIGNFIEGNTTGTYTFGGGEGGAGIALPYGSPVIQNNVIRNNVTRGSGGGLYVQDGVHVSIVQNLIYGNSADCGGGGIASKAGGLGPDTYILVANNAFFGNLSSGTGRSTECRKSPEVWTEGYEGGGPTAKFVNNIIDANATPALDCGYLQGTSFNPIDEAHQPLFDHNLFFDSAGSFFASNCVDTSHLHGNLVADPQFVDAAGHDFHLKAGSPAIDAGNGSVLQNLKLLSNVTLTQDLDGNPRELDATGKGSPTIDMGAYEFSGLADGTPTRVVLSSSSYSGPAGPLTLTATLSSGLGVPTGEVTFYSDGTQIGVTNAVNGVATLPNALFAPGVHVLLAAYAGQGLYPAAVSVVVIIDLNKYAGALNFTSSPNPSIVGQPVTFLVNVSEPDGMIPTPITLTYNNATLATLQPDASGNASFTTSSLPLGLDPVYANWPGDSTHAALSASVYQSVVNGYSTNTVLSCSPNPINIGGSALFSASVSSSNGTPTGTFSFTDNGAVLTQTPTTNGAASYNYIGTTNGAHTIVVSYIPTGAFAASSASCTETVNGLATTSVVSATPNPAAYGTPVRLTATVKPVSPTTLNPTGTVTFLVDGSAVGTGAVDPASGIAIFFNDFGLAGGNHNITCNYSGDSTFQGSACPVAPASVTAAPGVLELTAMPNPAYGETPITITANLASNGQAVGGASVVLSIYDGSFLYSQTSVVTDTNGNAVYIYRPGLPPGSYTLTASFAGNANVQPAMATPVTERVILAPTMTTLTASPNPAYLGQSVTLTATVASTVTSPFAPSGPVFFLDGTTLLGSANANAAGVATLTTSTLSLGNHMLSANSSVSFAFEASQSNIVSEVIVASGFTIALAPSTLTIGRYQAGTSAVQLTSVGNFSGPLTLTYGTLPQYGAAAIAPSTVTLFGGGTSSAVITVNALQRAMDDIPTPPGARGRVVIYAADLLLLLPLAFRRRRRISRVLALAAMAVALQGLTGCVNSYDDLHFVAAGTYTLPVTATDANGNSQTANLTVVVTP